jgi:hypothetical protein
MLFVGTRGGVHAAKMYIRHVYSDYDIEELMVRIDEAELPSLDVTLRQELQRECCMLVHFSYTQSCDGVVVVKMDTQASVQSSTIQTALDHLQDRRQARHLGQSEEGDSVRNWAQIRFGLGSVHE